MTQVISKHCGICGFTRQNKRVIIAGMVFWQCLTCKADSAYGLVRQKKGLGNYNGGDSHES